MGVELHTAKLPSVAARVDAMNVRLAWDLSVREVALYGARVSLNGSPETLSEQWRAFSNGPHASAPRQANIDVQAEGVDVVWERATADGACERVWGLSYARRGSHEDFAFDLAHLERLGLKLDLRGFHGRMVRAPDRSLQTLGAEGLDADVAMGGQPSTNARVQIDSTRGAELRAALRVVGDVVRRALPLRRELSFHDVSLHIHRAGEVLNLGPSELTLIRDDETLSAALSPPAELDGTRLEVHATLPLADGEAHVEVRGGPVTLASLGVKDGDFGLFGVKRARLEVSGDAGLSEDGARLSFSGSALAHELSLVRHELAPGPISGIRVAFRGRGALALDGSELKVDDGDFSIGEVHVQATGSLARRGTTLAGTLRAALPLASCQAILDAIPNGLAPLIAPLHMTGTLAATGSVEYDSLHPLSTRVSLDVTNDCRIDRISAEISPRRFATIFQREVKGADRLPMHVESGPGSPNWVPYEDISPFMETAVLVCEDGRFLRHRGFDYEAIATAVRDDLIAGRFARGASTVSMQLAKNLYLDSGKTLGRKVQEAALTLLLEQELDKRALMELYLNVIEYGPGIYGIGPAADYYFAKKPRDLSLGQSLYIASILPNPDHQYFRSDGRLGDAWAKYLQRLMLIAKKIKRITPEQLENGLHEQIAFRVADSGATSVGDGGTDTMSEGPGDEPQAPPDAP